MGESGILCASCTFLVTVITYGKGQACREEAEMNCPSEEYDWGDSRMVMHGHEGPCGGSTLGEIAAVYSVTESFRERASNSLPFPEYEEL